jgi:hypothetical protein
MLNKIYASRSQTRSMGMHDPIGDPFGGPAYGERNDPMSAALAIGGNLIGSTISGNAAKSAAQTSANAQLESARIAAEAQKFRPVGVTTNFGRSNFTLSPEGYVTEAGYQLSPELQALFGRTMGEAGAYDPTQTGRYAQALNPAAQGLFNLGQQYLATSPEQAAADYMRQQQGLLAPGREQQLSQLQNQQFQTGRSGLATGGTTAGYGAGQPGLMQANPQMAAYYNALAGQNAQLASQADAYGQARTQFGAGLFGTGAGLLEKVPSLTTAGYGPLQTQLGLASSIENLGAGALDIGAQIGGRAAQAGANVGNTLLQGGIGAARTMQPANAFSPLGSTISGAAGQIPAWYQNMISNPNSVQSLQNQYGAQNVYGGGFGGMYNPTYTPPTVSQYALDNPY